MGIKPILFSGPMIQALLDGRKTMDRRVLKPQPQEPCSHIEPFRGEGGGWIAGNNRAEMVKIPYAPGDLLYCREGFTTKNEGSRATPRLVPMYAADFEGFNKPDRDWSWSPSIHMPRKFSRLTLEVTAVKVERVQDISEADAEAEGVEFLFTKQECKSVVGLEGTKPEDHGWTNYLWHGRKDARPADIDEWEHQYSSYKTARESFSSLWQALNAKRGYGWDVNPWCAAVSFKVHHANVDTMKDAA